MKTIQEAIQNVALSQDYAYMVQRPNMLGLIFKKLFELYCRILFTVYCPLKIIGQQNLPTTSFILCSNHCSHLDSGALMVASGLSFKKCGMLAAKEYFFENKIRKAFLNLLMNLIPIDRKINHNELIQCLAACKRFVDKGGRNIIFYPEGTRSLTGEIQTVKHGPALFATELQLPIVPAYIKGTYEAWPKGKIFMKPKKIYAIIGDPIYPAQYTNQNGGLSKKQIYSHVSKELEKRIHELRECHLNGRYPSC